MIVASILLVNLMCIAYAIKQNIRIQNELGKLDTLLMAILTDEGKK